MFPHSYVEVPTRYLNVTIFRDKVFQEVVKLKGALRVEPSSNMTDVLIRKGHQGTAREVTARK